MASKLDVTEAKSRFDELLSRARAGEEILLSEPGKPTVRLGPTSEVGGTRIFGEFAGKVRMSPDFQASLTEQEILEWEA